ncbi:microneme protein, putative [Eimeria praecox]|uniref:Microneme protein, putative n=1 Tax=Eimeria praecox TaxID=51316 RepID=U6H0J1_9EIME|nr:microneme protein, putative [Eimeria praecox]
MKVPSALGFLAWATIQASEAIRRDTSFLSLSAGPEELNQETTSFKSLQDALDDYCQSEAQAACKSGLSNYCNAKVYARYDGQRNNANSKAWRCYAEESLNLEAFRSGCVDNCGNQKMCLGSYNGTSSTYLSRNSQLQSRVDEWKSVYCGAPPPTLQEALDRKCASFGEEACNQGLWAYCDVTLYARYDVGNASQTARDWRCYTQDALDFDISRDVCVDDCGHFTTCHGAVNGTSSSHLSRGKEIASVLLAEKEHYCNTETDVPETSDSIESDEVSETATSQSELQNVLDQICAEEGRRACNQGLNAYCGANMFARRDVGTQQQQTREWRCYAQGSLNLDKSGDGCVDNCGNIVSCLGAVDGASVTHLSRNSQLESAIAENKREFCHTGSEAAEASQQEEPAQVPETTTEPPSPPSRMQALLDSFCAEEGMFARRDIGLSSQQSREWRCYVQGSLNFGKSGDGCVDDCGNLISCSGAVDGSSSTHLSRNSQLESAIAANKVEFCNTGSETPEASKEEEPAEAPEATTEPPSLFARRDIGLSSQQSREWRCYVQGSLDFGISGDGCVDDCGNLVSCLGAVNGSSSVHLSRDSKAQEIIQKNKTDTCTQKEEGQESSGRPTPVPGPEGPEGAPKPDAPSKGLKAPPKVPGAGLLQDMIDSQCMAAIAKLCVSDDSMCQHAVARKSGSAWRCYPLSALDDSQSKDICIDDCGHALACPGVPKDGDASHIGTTDLTGLVKELREATCEMREEKKMRWVREHEQ